MDCTICLDVKKKISEMEHLECGHSLCIGCFKKLVRNTCPFCRHVISDKQDEYCHLENDNLTLDAINNEYQIDNFLPQSELDNIIENDIHSTYYTYEIEEQQLLQKLNKRICKKEKKTFNFRSNKERECWERKTKKNKKQRRVRNCY